MAIGQKLEEARNRKGISIREASESTKIRGDYLSAFEAGNFDLSIPDVYLRGFVKLYARFLDLDQEATVSDLDIELGASPRKASRKSLGSITKVDSIDSADYSTSNKIKKSNIKSSQDNLSKPLLLVLIGLVLFFVVVGTLVAIFSGDNPETNLNPSGSKINEISEEKSQSDIGQADEITTNIFTLRLSISGETELLIIDDEGDGAPSDFKNLSNGWTKEIKINKSFRCYCSNLENLRFAIDDGNEKKIDGNGPGNFSWSP